ncbi:MAG: photosystem II reaction center protein Ycf12 [Oscillatoriales cyanobacterium RU_3_3]|nr:photosystem II reaction center protein Ycf12 [Oscillatoriaceae cyanobacterium Prado104]NJL69754.1 photosystem II reaction center protein Ycf12 [Microcoleus sp. SM1_3_4]NJM63666.1 photosystem II reaction center protein Ycf12 [Oscillatoriales cyanobacterium RU_3_3]NJR24467.1 photosystem II reaction center protein Ycf12 [Richelia sp. CSU_2_1]
MDFITDLFAGVNFQLIIQVALLAAVVISGPIVIFLLAARGGDL